MKKIVLSAVLAILSVSASAEQEVKIYFEDADSYPYSMKNKSGLDIILLDAVAKKVGAKFVYTLVPWERCLSTMQTGDADGCFSASFKEKRMENGDYPMKDGKVDDSKRLRVASYSIFARNEDAAKYRIKGLDIEGLAKDKDAVASTLGYSIGDDYKKAGYKVDETATKSEMNMNKLLNGRVSVFAVMTPEGEYLANKAEYKGKIVKLSLPVVEKVYHLMLSKKFTAAHADLAKKIWDAIAEVRESEEFKDQSTGFLAK